MVNMMGVSTTKGTTALHIASERALKLWADVADATKGHASKFPEPFEARDKDQATEYNESKAKIASTTADAKKAVDFVKLLIGTAGVDRDAKDGDDKTAWDKIKGSDKAGAVAALIVGLA